MTELVMTSDIKVKLVRSMADDEFVIEAARVSVKEFDDIVEEVGPNPEKLLNTLMQLRHGVPWEHQFFTFYAEVPIFTARQWVKHRMSSLNEKSGRYGKLLPRFYSPEADRPMINEGSKMRPKMVPGSFVQHQVVRNSNLEIAQAAWNSYEFQLKYGIAEEMARSVLPVSIYTQFIWSVNARSLFNFLERRVDSPASRVPSHPQWEIQLGANQMEAELKRIMPISHAAFIRHGRVAP